MAPLGLSVAEGDGVEKGKLLGISGVVGTRRIGVMFRGAVIGAAVLFMFSLLYFGGRPSLAETEVTEVRVLDERMDKLAQVLSVIDTEKSRLEARLEELQDEYRSTERLILEEHEKVVRDLVALSYIKDLMGELNANSFMAASHLWSLEIMQKSLIRQRTSRITDMRLKLEQLSAIRKDIDQNLAELNATRNRYEDLIEKLKALRVQRAKAMELARAERSEVSLRAPDVPGLEEDQGPGVTAFRKGLQIAGMKGKLSLPVDGMVVTEFPEKNNTALLILRYNRGVFIKARPGEYIRSVADGKVVFARWFRDLGRMVIIDHGDHFFSVYGLLGSFLKKEGDQVREGEPIGAVGPPELAPLAGIYFEWRKNGRPLAVKDWFLISER